MGSHPPVPPIPPHSVASRGAVPEILPPESGYGPPQRPRRPRPRWAMAPATYTLVGINCAVFLLMTFAGISPIRPTSEALYYWGADHAGSVLVAGQWWRIVTAMFVHGGILHIGLNMWCLWNLGLLAEPLMGSLGLFAVYILTGAAGNLLSTLWNWWEFVRVGNGGGPVGVGASGAVFGIAGALIVLLKSPRLPVPPHEVKGLRKSVIYFAVINLVIGLSINVGARVTGVMVDNSAHIGGFASGLLFAVPMIPRIGNPRRPFQLRLRVAIFMLTGILVLFGFYLSHLAH